MTNSSPSTPSTTGAARSWSTSQGLYRSATNRRIKGVCGGISERYNIDASYVRIGFVFATVALMANVSGWFFFSYFVAMVFIGNRPQVGAASFSFPTPPASAPSPTMPAPTAPVPTMPAPTAPVPTAPVATMPVPTMPAPTMPVPTAPEPAPAEVVWAIPSQPSQPAPIASSVPSEVIEVVIGEAK